MEELYICLATSNAPFRAGSMAGRASVCSLKSRYGENLAGLGGLFRPGSGPGEPGENIA